MQYKHLMVDKGYLGLVDVFAMSWDVLLKIPPYDWKNLVETPVRKLLNDRQKTKKKA